MGALTRDFPISLSLGAAPHSLSINFGAPKGAGWVEIVVNDYNNEKLKIYETICPLTGVDCR